MKKILILGAGEMQVPIIEKCNVLGYETIVTDYSEEAPGLKRAKIPLVIDTLDKEKTLKAAQEYKIDGILTTSDAPVRTVAYVSNKLKLPGISEEAASIGTDKYLQRKILRKSGLNCPRFLQVINYDDLKRKVVNWSFPIIIKPVDSSASRGVSKVNDASYLKSAFLEAKEFSKSGNILGEEFITGKEYSIESLTQNGETSIVAITEKSVIKNSDYFVEERHVIPANLNGDQIDEIKKYVQQIIKLFEIDNSATHIEIMLNEKGPVLIELGVRLGGDFITSHLVPLATGVDMQKNIILLALNEKIEISRNLHKFAGVQFVHGGNYEPAKKAITKEDYFVKAELKDFSNISVKNSLDRLGYFIFTEETREKLLEKLDFKNIE